MHTALYGLAYHLPTKVHLHGRSESVSRQRSGCSVCGGVLRAQRADTILRGFSHLCVYVCVLWWWWYWCVSVFVCVRVCRSRGIIFVVFHFSFSLHRQGVARLICISMLRRLFSTPLGKKKKGNHVTNILTHCFAIHAT